MAGQLWQLTPSQDIVPEELLFPDEHGHYDEGVQVDPFTQHPEDVGGVCVLHQHCQDFTGYLKGHLTRVWRILKIRLGISWNPQSTT